jgi:hypothetical protein
VSALVDAVGAWSEIGHDELIVPDFVLGRGQQKLDAMDAILAAVTPFR